MMELNDVQLAERLIGTWETDPSENAAIVSTIAYNADGTGMEIVRFSNQPERPPITVHFKWSVAGSILTTKAFDTSNIELVPIGLKLSNRILSITDNRMVSQAGPELLMAEGEQSVKVRVV